LSYVDAFVLVFIESYSQNSKLQLLRLLSFFGEHESLSETKIISKLFFRFHFPADSISSL